MTEHTRASSGVLTEGRDWDTDARSGTLGEDGCMQSRGEAPEDTNPAGTLILDFQPQEL